MLGGGREGGEGGGHNSEIVTFLLLWGCCWFFFYCLGLKAFYQMVMFNLNKQTNKRNTIKENFRHCFWQTTSKMFFFFCPNPCSQKHKSIYMNILFIAVLSFYSCLWVNLPSTFHFDLCSILVFLFLSFLFIVCPRRGMCFFFRLPHPAACWNIYLFLFIHQCHNTRLQ